ncbi:MAG: type II toxin-antitoxin system Phd/YefM family antitoxin [Betaproteobacteria bacterium]|nr:MAG: type II toxin-antitoxin system Phd/YefM family antitoxin [Betaproteobacteria bacterium]
MKTLSLSEAKAKLSGLIEDVERRDEEIVITRNGTPVAVLVSADEYDSWKETLAIRADRDLMGEIKTGLAALKARKARLYTLDELLG